MRMHQKVAEERYCVYARRNDKEPWTDWTQVNDLDRANHHIENIREYGFLANLHDREIKEVLIKDGSQAVS